MFEELEKINERPEPFQFCTTGELWTNEHTSEQMLSFHLNGTHDVSSRKAEFISRSVAWIVSEFNVGRGFSLADFGCGPGLYTTPLAKHGAAVTGIDFSARSIAYAGEVAAREQREFMEAGFTVQGLYSDVAGTPFERESSEFAVVAGKRN